MATSKVLSWGKCTVKVTPISGSGASVESEVTFPTPVESSTQLNTSQGDKTEAKVEGGAVEAARYGANSYELQFQIRMHSSLKTLPLDGPNGVIDGEYSVEIIPEASAAPKVKINRTSGNVKVSYTSADGVLAAYTFSSLEVEDGNQIEIS